MDRLVIVVCLMAMAGVIYGQQGRGNGQQNNQNGGPFTGNQRQPQAGQRQGQGQPGPFGGPNGPNGFGIPNGPNTINGFNGPRGFNAQQQQQQQQQQGQLQLQLQGQPSLVNIGGCSRGVSLRNSDGSTLRCGWGPRDFACPPKFDCTFDSGLQATVCCPSGANFTNVDQGKEDSQPNPCPDSEPIKDELGNRLKCDFAGGPRNACPAGTLCVVGACCPVSVAGLVSVKPGSCPLPLPIRQGQNCQNDCTFDADCPGPAKCCFVGCGARCVASVQNGPESNPNAHQIGQNPQNVGGPLSGNGANLGQFNLQQQAQLNRQGFGQQGPQQFGQQQGFGPQGQQQNNPFFNQQRQQFQFPNNGPPGTFNGNGPRQGPPGFQQRPQNGPQQQQPRPQQFQP